jgi:inorganic pyrophosphatase
MEINKQKANNPIVQDIKKGKPRELTYGGAGIPFNYGALPQTWEDSEESHGLTHQGKALRGDNDPLDVVEISAQSLPMGDVSRVKVLGVLALVDEGELDWKLIAVNERDPLFNKLRDIQDLKEYDPQLLQRIFHWFRMYKTADGKPENQFALDGQVMDSKYALDVIAKTHERWKDLVSNGRDGIWTNN